MDLGHYKSAVFDCDGVILDSNGMKSAAFRRSLEGEDPALVDRFIRYHQANGGVSRYVKFLHFFREMKRVPDFEKRAEETMRHYSALSREGLFGCRLIPGVLETVKSFHGRGVPCHVLSGGDQEEILSVFAARELSRHFEKILGSPKTKEENLALLEKEGWLRRPGVYFGDARADFEAARRFNLDFVFVEPFSEWGEGKKTCEKEGWPVVTDFTSLRR